MATAKWSSAEYAREADSVPAYPSHPTDFFEGQITATIDPLVSFHIDGLPSSAATSWFCTCFGTQSRLPIYLVARRGTRAAMPRYYTSAGAREQDIRSAAPVATPLYVTATGGLTSAHDRSVEHVFSGRSLIKKRLVAVRRRDSYIYCNVAALMRPSCDRPRAEAHRSGDGPQSRRGTPGRLLASVEHGAVPSFRRPVTTIRPTFAGARRHTLAYSRFVARRPRGR